MNESEKRKFEQALMDATRRDEYKQCLVNNGCPNDAVKGHSVPVAYMKRLPGYDGQMRVFNTPRFGRLPPELPMVEGVGHASTGYFTCEVHEALFRPADEIVDISAMPDRRTLNLMCYRNLLYTRWWFELWSRAAEKVDDQLDKPIQRGIASKLRAYSQGFVPAQARLEECVLATREHQCARQGCSFFEHMMFAAEGLPVLAASQFGVQEYFPTQMGAWGITMIPGTGSNYLIMHFPGEIGTRAMDIAFPSLQQGRQELSGMDISRALLKFLPNIIFTGTTWSALTSDEQAMFKQAVAPWKDNPTSYVNLFKGTTWKIL